MKKENQKFNFINNKESGSIQKPLIIVIDDEASMRDSCCQVLTKEGFCTETAENGFDGLKMIEALKPDLVLIDLKMPVLSGLEVLDRLKKIDVNIIPVVITGYPTLESAVATMKKGAYDFLPKPFTPDELRVIVKRGLERRKLVLETESLRLEKKLMEENFITMVSHQLRSPAIAVLQYFESILFGAYGEVPQKQKEILRKIKERLEGFLTLINDWLDIARVNKGQIVDNFKPLSLRTLLKRLIEQMRPLAQRNNINLEFGDCSENNFLQGDEEALEQVFSNLITNAIQYNKSGGRVILTIAEDDSCVAIKVKDTGIGIAKEHFHLIFDQFYRIKKHNGKKGTGLGLAIAQKIVDAHNGSIQVSSELGQGSTFTVLLPKAKPGRNQNKEAHSN